MSYNTRNTLITTALLAAACAGAPPANLVDARAAYQRAAEGPAEQLAPAQLHAAETYLKLAEQTYDDEGDSPNTRDRAYVAMRKAELAEVQASIAKHKADATKSAKRGEMAEQEAHVATTNELANTRAQLAAERGVTAEKDTLLQSETERRKQAESAQQQAMQALQALGDVKQDPRGTVITLSGSVIFASGKADLLPSARNKLSEVATALKQSADNSKIVVEGHTDSVGSDTMNQELSKRRADSVRESLVSNGVPASKIEVEGYGASRPVADNGSPAGRANNRRVEIVIQSADAPHASR